ncbi:5'-3' exonuclease H3TH domain-containing protein [Pallidibacillus thermolactis]|uniref:5'-3' exonuclease H3TH domain-containing protein n=1 Tax=Pallidibacillus thermolactis TaxID=251051 RepID=UPI0035E73296
MGPKTAEKLILQYKTVENLLASIDKLKPAQRKKIESDRDILILSRKLAEIKLDVPLTFKLKDAEIRFFHDQLYANINAIKIKGMARILDMIKEWNKEHLFEDFA